MRKLFYIGAFAAFLLVGCNEESNKNAATTVTPDEFNKLEIGMSLKEAEKIVGGKPKNPDEKENDNLLLFLDYDGENGVDEDSSVTLIFRDGKLNTILEDGLLKEKQKEELPQETVTITPDEFKKLKKGMSLDEVENIVGGKAKSYNTNQTNEKLITYEYDGEHISNKDSKITLLFDDGKLDTITQFGLIETEEELAEREAKAKLNKEQSIKENTTEQNVDTSSVRKAEIKTATAKIITSDLSNTDIKSIEINNYQLEENKYITLINLKWNQTNSKSTTVEMLEMYSDNIAATLYEESEIEEITIFWEVPYHSTGENIAKFNYIRAADGMAKNDKWLAPVLQ